MELFASKCFIFLVLSTIPILSDHHSSKSSSPIPIIHLYEYLKSLGRIVNAISVEQGLRDGTFSQSNVIHELLNVEKSITRRMIDEELVAKLPNDISVLASVGESVCGEDDEKCKVPEVILKGVDVAESFKLKDTDVQKLLDENSPAQLLFYIMESQWLYRDQNSLTNNIRTIKSNTAIGDKDLKPMVLQVQKTLKKFLRYKTLKSHPASRTLTNNNIRQMIDSIPKYGSFSNLTTDKLWMKSLRSIQEVFLQMNSTSIRNTLSSMIGKVRLSHSITFDSVRPIEEMSLMPGFKNGSSDISKLQKDMKSEFVRNNVLNRAVFNRQKYGSVKFILQSMLNPIMEVKSLIKSDKVADMFGVFEKHLQLARNEFDDLTWIRKFFDCFGYLSGFDWNIWRRYPINHEGVIDYLDGLDKLHLNLRISSALEKKLKGNNFHNSRLVLQTFDNLDELEKELSDARVQIQRAMPVILDIFFNDRFFGDFGEAFTKTKQWLKIGQVNSIPRCIDDKTMLKKTKKLLQKREILSELRMFKSPSNITSAVSEAIKTLKEFISKWATLENSTFLKTPDESEKLPRLQNAQKICKDLNLAINLLIRLQTAFSAEKHIEHLLSKEKEIDQAISETKNSEAKGKLGIWWNEDSKHTLRNVTRIASMFQNKTIPKPTNLEGYGVAFDAGVDFNGLVNINMKILMDSLISVNIKSLDPEVMEELRDLDLKFAHSDSILKSGREAFYQVAAYFNGYSNISNPKPVEMGYGKNTDDSISTVTIGAITGGILLLLALVAFVTIFMCRWKSLKNTKN